MNYLDLWIVYFPHLLQGLFLTLQLVVITLASGSVIGLATAAARLSGIGFVMVAARIYVDVVRATPEILQLFIVFFALPQVGLQLTAFEATIVFLTFNGGAYWSEAFRAGIEAIDSGQWEAGRALGLRLSSLFRHIILPQAFAVVLPALAGIGILQIKMTSLAYLIGVPELMSQAYKGAYSTTRTMPFYLLAAAMYFVVCYSLALVARRLERRAAATTAVGSAS